jgi:uncharacterized protein YkwD
MRYSSSQRQRLYLHLGWLVLSVTACAHQPTSGTYSLSNLSAFEQSVFKEINRARTQPTAYAAFLEETKAQYDSLLPKIPGEERHQPDDFLRPLYEAIAVLKATTPLPALTLSRGLTSAARDHLRDQSLADTVSHTGSDGNTLAERVNRYGVWQSGIGENIASGSGTAQRLVMQMIIDQSDPARQHRLNILNPAFSVGGIACGNSPQYRNLCIITFAGNYVDKTAGAQ